MKQTPFRIHAKYLVMFFAVVGFFSVADIVAGGRPEPIKNYILALAYCIFRHFSITESK